MSVNLISRDHHGPPCTAWFCKKKDDNINDNPKKTTQLRWGHYVEKFAVALRVYAAKKTLFSTKITKLSRVFIVTAFFLSVLSRFQ